MARKAEHLRIAHIQDDPGEMTDLGIVSLNSWKASDTTATTMVSVAQIRSIPSRRRRGEETVQARLHAVTSGQWEPELWVARLPSGKFVDIDTPYDCEVVKRARFAFVIVHILGTLTESGCAGSIEA